MKLKQKAVLVTGMIFLTGLLGGCGSQSAIKSSKELDEQIKEHMEQHFGEYLDQYYEKMDQEWADYDGDDMEEPERVNFSSLKSFQAETIDGGTFTSEDIAAKDVTVINFWSLLCGYCIDELPEIAKYTNTLPNNVQVITVCLGLESEADIKEAKDILKQSGFNGITLMKGDGDFETVCGEIQYTPTTIFMDKDGNTVGNAITSSVAQGELAETYTKSVNQVLQSMGKEEIK